MELSELGKTIDKLYELRETRLGIERQVKELKTQENEYRAEILLALGTAGLAKASGTVATCGVISSKIPAVVNWELLHDYVRVNNRFDLLHKRVSVTAWRDLVESGAEVPGVESIEDVDISLTKSVRG